MLNIVIRSREAELVVTADCGIYAEPENINDIVSKIKFVMNEWDNILNTKGENGYLYAKKYFDRTFLGEQYVSLIEEKLGN